MADSNTTGQRLYAVFRNGRRVSDSEYESEAFAQREYKYWQGILKRHPDGSRLEIRQVYVRDENE